MSSIIGHHSDKFEHPFQGLRVQIWGDQMHAMEVSITPALLVVLISFDLATES